MGAVRSRLASAAAAAAVWRTTTTGLQGPVLAELAELTPSGFLESST